MLWKFWVAALIAVFGSAAQGQNAPPAPGTTKELQNGQYLLVTGKNSEGIALLLRACDIGDALGCAELAHMATEQFNLVADQRSGVTQSEFAKQAVQLLRRRCSPTEDFFGCDAYLAMLSNFNYRSVHPELVLEGARFLANRCLAGMTKPYTCFATESFLDGGSQEERTALKSWVDIQFQQACASGDSVLCASGFSRKSSPLMSGGELGQRILRLVEPARQGCSEGSPLICVEASMFLFEHTTGQGRSLAADFMAAACRLAPKSGERDIQQAACETEKKMREAITKGS